MTLIAVGDFIDGLLGFGVFDSLTDDGDKVTGFLHSLQTELGGGAVATEDGDGLQAEEHLEEVLALGEINDPVELDIVFVSCEDTLGLLQLLTAEGIYGASQLDLLIYKVE